MLYSCADKGRIPNKRVSKSSPKGILNKESVHSSQSRQGNKLTRVVSLYLRVAKNDSNVSHQAEVFGAIRRNISRKKSSMLRSTASVGEVGVHGNSPIDNRRRGAGEQMQYLMTIYLSPMVRSKHISFNSLERKSGPTHAQNKHKSLLAKFLFHKCR